MSEVSALRVFISYARRDCTEFAEELLAGLEVAGFDPFLDKHDIAAGEDWEARLGGLIAAADTIVFVISPASVASERCAWEVAKAEEFSKRIVPIVAFPVSEADTPLGLKRLNYIFFSEGNSFARGLGELAKALRIDLDWIREHTRLAELAARWRDRNKAEVLLLRGSELEAAKAWLNEWKAGAPEPSDLHRTFIGESDVAESNALISERKRLEQLSRRTTIGLISAGGLTAVAGGLAYWGYQERVGREAAEQRSEAARIARDSARTDIAGQFTAYAAAPGEPAADSTLYSDSVLAELANEDISFQAALARAHAAVYRNSPANARQRPFFSSDLNGDLYLRRSSGARRTKALVIGVDGWGESQLPGVPPELRVWSAFFDSCGFEHETLLNPSAEQITDAFQRTITFSNRDASLRRRDAIVPASIEIALASADTLAILFYAGGGISVDGDLFLTLPVFSQSGVQSTPNWGIRLADLQTKLRRAAAASILVLDTNFIQWTPGPVRPQR